MKIAVRRIPSTSQNRSDEPSWSLIRLVAPTGMTKKRPIARISDSATVSAPDEAADRLRLLSVLGLDLRVGRDRQCPEADPKRLRQRHHAADHRPAKHPVALRPRDQRLRGHLDCSVRLSHGHRPGRDAAHHHALEHRLAAHGRVAAGHRQAVRHPRLGEARAARRTRGRRPRTEGSGPVRSPSLHRRRHGVAFIPGTPAAPPAG